MARKYGNLDLEIMLLEDELLDDPDDVDYRKICSKLSAVQDLKAKELDIAIKRKELSKSINPDTLISSAVSLLSFAGFVFFEKTDVVTLKNSVRHLNS